MELLFAQSVKNFVVVKLDADGIGLATIHNSGNPTGMAQAAARTRTLFATRNGIEFHGKTPVMGVGPIKNTVHAHCGNTSSAATRSEEHTSELQSLMRISYAVFCLKKKKPTPSKT